jgi:hypothetical protein
MRKSFIIFFLCCLIFVWCQANLNNTQQLLFLGKHELAKEKIDKALLKDSANYQALYWYARYYFDSENKFYHTDSAYKYILSSISCLPAETDKFYLKNLKYGYSSTRFQTLKKDILEAAYFAIEQEDKISSYNHFLSIYRDSYFEKLATKHRDDLAFGEAKEKMDFMSFKEFMDKYPNANQSKEARSLYEKLLYENVIKEGSWQAYKFYLDHYPDASYRNEASSNYERLLFEEYSHANDAQKLYEFIYAYPENAYRSIAESMLLSKACYDFDSETLIQYIQAYPHSNKVPHVWQLIYLVETADDEDSSYAQFIQHFPDYPFKDQVVKDSSLAHLKLYAYESNGLYGFKNRLNDSMIQLPIYYDVQEFSGRLCAAASSPALNHTFKYGFINKQFEFAIAPTYDEVYDFEAGLAIVGIGNCPNGLCRYGIINELGDTVLPIEYNDVHEFHDGLALVESSAGRIGYVNNAGNDVIAPQFSKGRNFSENIAAVQLDSGWFFIDRNGVKTFPTTFYAITDFKNGVSSFSNDGNVWGIIASDGRIIKQPLFKEPIVFDGLTAKVQLEEKVEKKGKIKYVLNDYLLYRDGTMVKIE